MSLNHSIPSLTGDESIILLEKIINFAHLRCFITTWDITVVHMFIFTHSARGSGGKFHIWLRLRPVVHDRSGLNTPSVNHHSGIFACSTCLHKNLHASAWFFAWNVTCTCMVRMHAISMHPSMWHAAVHAFRHVSRMHACQFACMHAFVHGGNVNMHACM